MPGIIPRRTFLRRNLPMKLDKIMEVADALSMLAITFKEAEVDAKALSALSALDEDIYNNLIIISEALGLKVQSKDQESQTVDETKTEEAKPDETTEAFGRKKVVGFTAPEPEEPEPVVVAKAEEKDDTDAVVINADDIIPAKISDEVVPGYFATKYPNILISRDGHVIYKATSNSGWTPLKAYPDANGTLRIRIKNNSIRDLTFPISRTLLETFVGIPTDNWRSCTVLHKDGDKNNLELDNLVWLGHRIGRPHLSEDMWESAFQIGVKMMRENPATSMTDIGRALHSKKIMGVTSWMESYKRQPELFNKYFRKEGRKVFLRETPVESIEAQILLISDKAKQISETRSYISGKGVLKDNDKVLPILTCIKSNTSNNLDSTANIMNKLNKRYGKLYISAALVDKVKDKKLCKDLCDLVF